MPFAAVLLFLAAEPATVLTGHSAAITTLAYAPDGKSLASGSKDGTVRLWGADGKVRAVLPGHGRMVTALAFSPDGKALVTAGYTKGLTFWDTSTGKKTGHWKGHRNEA